MTEQGGRRFLLELVPGASREIAQDCVREALNGAAALSPEEHARGIVIASACPLDAISNRVARCPLVMRILALPLASDEGEGTASLCDDFPHVSAADSMADDVAKAAAASR